MSGPKRVQLRRTKGWRKPEGCVVVARPSKWGNPHTITYARNGWYRVHIAGTDMHGIAFGLEAARQRAVDEYAATISSTHDLDLSKLAGRDLACWCPLDQPCHADVLLDLANPARPVTEGSNE